MDSGPSPTSHFRIRDAAFIHHPPGAQPCRGCSACDRLTVPLLTAVDLLPSRPNRVIVAGTSGAGKTTVAEIISELIGLPRVELDALRYGPGWTRRPEFEAEVERFTAGPRWVTEFQYLSIRHLLLDRADLLVWLDLPRSVVIRALVRRTITRRLRREALWNGDYESPLRTFFTDPHHCVRSAWRRHGPQRIRLTAVVSARPDLHVVRLTSRGEVARWVRGPLRAAA